MELDQNKRRYFRDELRSARAQVLKDAEGFRPMIHAVERLGSYLNPHGGGLAAYREGIREICAESAMFDSVNNRAGSGFNDLYQVVKDARNEAAHVGATARHLAFNATLLSLLIEDGLVGGSAEMQDFMVSEPLCAESWQPIALIRQKMLTNSFSFLPVRPRKTSDHWQLVSDSAVAKYLRSGSNTKRKTRLAHSLQEAVESGDLKLESATCCRPDGEIEAILDNIDQRPVLLFDDDKYTRLMGLLTAFDLL